MLDILYNTKLYLVLSEEISTTINYYNNPEFVIRFQHFCGLKSIQPSEKNKNSKDYVADNKFLHYLFTFSSLFGEEIFAIIFFTLLLNIFDPFMGRQVMLMWCLAMYLGECMKDFFQMERPPSPPVVRLETTYSSQYGMPSTHAIAATSIATGLVLNPRWQMNMAVSLVLSTLWCLTIGLSRMYKGVHSVADVAVGNLLSVCLGAVLYPVLTQMDLMIIDNWTGILVFFVLIVTMGTAYPHPPVWNSSRSECFVILGSIFGVMLGSRCDIYFLENLESRVYENVSLANQLLRLPLVVAVVYLVKSCFKPLLQRALARVLDLDHHQLTHRRQRHFEMLYHSIMYCLLGWITTLLIPRLSQQMGLGRLYPY